MNGLWRGRWRFRVAEVCEHDGKDERGGAMGEVDVY